MPPAVAHPALHADAWLGARLRRTAWRIDPAHLDEGCDDLADALRAEPCFASARVSTASPATVARLNRLGFTTVDTTVTWEREAGAVDADAADVDVRPATPADREAVAAIAATAFTFDRFHLDPHVDGAVADRIKRDWASAYFDGTRGQAMLVGRVDGRVAGFLLVVVPDSATAIIDLIATDRAIRRRGVAAAMTATIPRHVPDVRRLRVGTQVANLPALNAYRRLGFEIVRTEYVLHFHHPG
ncbi:MAG: GNAT family N-acetyltransferase [Phycisphaerales bacterium]|nr:GNAT family N-acetyltransferase [Phycisphaerales bacterium]